MPTCSRKDTRDPVENEVKNGLEEPRRQHCDGAFATRTRHGTVLHQTIEDNDNLDYLSFDGWQVAFWLPRIKRYGCGRQYQVVNRQPRRSPRRAGRAGGYRVRQIRLPSGAPTPPHTRHPLGTGAT